MTATQHRTRPAADLPSDADPAEGASQVVERAFAAWSGWRTTAPSDRARALRRAAEAVRRNADGLGDMLCATTGRLLREARASAQVAADLLDEAAVTGLSGGRALAGAAGAADWVRTEPRGVVAVITPWNDPFPAAAGLIAAALVTGNTVVHKPSERSLGPDIALTRIIGDCLPRGVLDFLAGGAEAGRALVEHPQVAVVAHIGSSESGASVREACGRRGALALTENGGNDPLIVDAGVDPVWAAQQIATGAFNNAGQLCTSVERVYVHAAVAEPVVAELVRCAQRLRPGDPADDETTLGPLVDEAQLAIVAEHVDDAVRRGARVLTGGSRLDRRGAFFAPTVLDRCTEDMLVMTQETFGPVAPVVVVDSWEEGLLKASSGRYGLAATVLTPDTAHALEAIETLEVGTVKVNAVFGGAPGGSADPRRDSGRGRGYGPDLLRELVALKAVHWEPAQTGPGREAEGPA
jgi:succinate-semialdehyde dehydrogenase/glutarate-semialdehyde dehydrogenase